MGAKIRRRMLSLVLLLAGIQAAYPQSSFPQNLSNSNKYWKGLVTFLAAPRPTELGKQWSRLSNQSLSTTEVRFLQDVLNLAKYQIADLLKEEKQFLLKYGHLAIYLSGMNPTAADNFDRAGIWMLTYPDARRYGLVVNEQIDERRDIPKSTLAAKALFRDLKRRHGANAEVMFALGAAGWARSSKDLIDAVGEHLKALRLILKSYHGGKNFSTKKTWLLQSFEGEISIDILTSQLQLDSLELRRMNPILVGWRIPRGTHVLLPSVVDGRRLVSETKTMEVLHKKKLANIVSRVKRNIPSPLTQKEIIYRVKAGDVLGRIAEYYGVRVSKIKQWNNLRSDHIAINQKLTIIYPKGKKVPRKAISKKTPKSKVKPIAEEVGKFTIYEVQKGDTLWAICQKLADIEPEDIMSWNGIGEDIRIGQKLKIKTRN